MADIERRIGAAAWPSAQSATRSPRTELCQRAPVSTSPVVWRVVVRGQEIEFLSLGAHDLAQHTFAADHQVGALPRLPDPWQPALLDLVMLSAEAAKAESKNCGVCGEVPSDPLLACADPLLACALTGLGSSPCPWVRHRFLNMGAILGKYTLAQCERAVGRRVCGGHR